MPSLDRSGWRGYVAISLVWMTVLAGVLLFTRRPATQPIEIIPPPTAAPTATSVPAPTPRPMRIDVAGAVVNPRVVTLPPGSIVADAIAAAGGPSPDAGLDRLNQAVELQDGTQVYVPRRSETPPVPPVSSPPAKPEATPPVRAGPTTSVLGLININAATLAELDTLPGVGPKTAQLIVDGRPYAKVDDLLRVKGIGPATLAKLQDLVTVR